MKLRGVIIGFGAAVLMFAGGYMATTSTMSPSQTVLGNPGLAKIEGDFSPANLSREHYYAALSCLWSFGWGPDFLRVQTAEDGIHILDADSKSAAEVARMRSDIKTCLEKTNTAAR